MNRIIIGHHIFFKRTNGQIRKGQIFQINESSFLVRWFEFSENKMKQREIMLSDFLENQVPTTKLIFISFMCILKKTTIYEFVSGFVIFSLIISVIFNWINNCSSQYTTNYVFFNVNNTRNRCKSILQVQIRYAFLKNILFLIRLVCS